ncbi:MAG: hypothetical protein JNM17_41275 [Archangium sp.]|nr:hypothetical protein [Archangium sp.]
MRRLLLLPLLLATSAHAQADTSAGKPAGRIVAGVLDATNVPDASVKRLQRATEVALKQVSGLNVGEGPTWKKGAPKKCGTTDECAADLAASLGNAILIDLKAVDGKGERVSIELQLWVDGEKLGAKRGEGSVDGFETAIKPVIEALLPAWARKGFGGLRLDVEPGVVVKVDGRLVSSKAGEIFAVPAGAHQVDVIFAEGHAVLQRLEVAEGSRVKLEALSPAEAVSGRGPRGTSALRGVSYGVFVAGSAAIAGGLVAGALGRGTGEGLASCQGDSRNCQTLDVVLEKQSQAQAYATTGNVMLGVGVGLAITGAGLFLIDVLTN